MKKSLKDSTKMDKSPDSKPLPGEEGLPIRKTAEEEAKEAKSEEWLDVRARRGEFFKEERAADRKRRGAFADLVERLRAEGATKEILREFLLAGLEDVTKFPTAAMADKAPLVGRMIELLGLVTAVEKDSIVFPPGPGSEENPLPDG